MHPNSTNRSLSCLKIVITKTLILARIEVRDPRTRIASLPRLILLIQIVLRPCISPDQDRLVAHYKRY